MIFLVVGATFVFTFASSMIIFSYIDYTFESVQYRLEQSVYICEQLDSKPRSLDQYSVTCEDGRTIYFLKDKR